MVAQHAAVHDDEESRRARLARRRFVHGPVLHPDRLGADRDRGVDDGWHELRAPEHVDDLDRAVERAAWSTDLLRGVESAPPAQTRAAYPLLLAATPRGLARIAFEADDTALIAAFPAAAIRAATGETLHRLAHAVAEVDLADPQLPEAARRTAFEEAVSCRWLALATKA